MRKRQIEISSWQERPQTFALGNKDRASDFETGGMAVVKYIPLKRVDYDEPSKGISLTLEGFVHTVNSQVEFYLTGEANGVVSPLEELDQNFKPKILDYYNFY